MPDPTAFDRIQTRRLFYDLQFTSMVDWSVGDCDDPLTEINDDIFLGYWWGDILQTTTSYCSMPQTLEDVNIADNNCFDFETFPINVTFRTALQAAPVVVSLTATINYCA
jgi:hypothetical protein